jgi:hypothetical protein
LTRSMRTKSQIAIACLFAAGAFLTNSSTARAQRPGVDTAQQGTLQRGILQTPQKPKVPINIDYNMIMAMEPGQAALNNSMKTRRDYAWQTVKQLWAPVQVQGGKIPTWMTWYDQEDIEDLYREMLYQQPKPGTSADRSTAAPALLRRHAVKDLRVSLNSARLGKVLRQFTFAEFHALGPNLKPSTGTIYYSPAYVKHLLQNADNIAECDTAAPPALSRSVPTQKSPQGQLTPRTRAPQPLPQPRQGPVTPQSGPTTPQIRDAGNIYALCMDHEMPPDAVMIKTAWTPYDEGAKRPLMGGDDDGDDQLAKGLKASATGKWIFGSLVYTKFGALIVTDENGKQWALMAMHIARKKSPTWMWTSLFWGADGPSHGAWQSDEPNSLRQEWLGVFRYGMCTVSDFKESDPTPWSAYEDGDPFKKQPLANALKSVANLMNGYQWCANPFIEINMSRGNCVGCHQGSTESFLPGEIAKRRKFNISDFSFSFATNRANIIKIRQQHAAQQKIKVSK